MQYYTRLQESPSLVILAMLNVNPTTKVEVVALDDRYGRTVALRTIESTSARDVDSVYVCAGNNPVFVANVIALAHAHNIAVDASAPLDLGDGI